MNQSLILIPAYNEQDNIGRVLSDLLELRLDADIVVVDDGSLDNTAKIAREFPVEVISHPVNLGYGAALQTGYRYADRWNYAYVIQFDADGQHNSGDIERLIETLQNEETDIVIGSRFIGKNAMNMDWSKRSAIVFFRYLIYFFTKARITDPTSGMRGFSRRVFENFTTRFPVDFPDTNLLIQSLLQRVRVKEIGVSMKDREYGESMHAGFKKVIYMVQILLCIFIVVVRHRLSGQENKI